MPACPCSARQVLGAWVQSLTLTLSRGQERALGGGAASGPVLLAASSACPAHGTGLTSEWGTQIMRPPAGKAPEPPGPVRPGEYCGGAPALGACAGTVLVAGAGVPLQESPSPLESTCAAMAAACLPCWASPRLESAPALKQGKGWRTSLPRPGGHTSLLGSFSDPCLQPWKPRQLLRPCRPPEFLPWGLAGCLLPPVPHPLPCLAYALIYKFLSKWCSQIIIMFLKSLGFVVLGETKQQKTQFLALRKPLGGVGKSQTRGGGGSVAEGSAPGLGLQLGSCPASASSLRQALEAVQIAGW